MTGDIYLADTIVTCCKVGTRRCATALTPWAGDRDHWPWERGFRGMCSRDALRRLVTQQQNTISPGQPQQCQRAG